MQLKRLWDITTKQMVFVKWPTGHECQLWVDEATEKTYYYDMAQWLEYTQSAWNDGRTYWPTWKVVDSDDEMWVYDTDEPTELFTWESGDQVSYVFKDWDGTVLKEGKVDEWTKPTAPADPTREATAQYTYTFAGWNPEVAKITKKTTYTATYTATVNKYTVTFATNDDTLGTVSPASVANVPYGTAITSSNNTVTVGETTATAAAETGCEFSSWSEIPSTVTGNVTITATFTSTTPAYSPVNNLNFVGEHEETPDDPEEEPTIIPAFLRIFYETWVDEINYIKCSWDGLDELTFYWACDTQLVEDLFSDSGGLGLTSLIVQAVQSMSLDQQTDADLTFTTGAWGYINWFFAGTYTAQEAFEWIDWIIQESWAVPWMWIIEEPVE